jgi:hypothetical protein
MSYAQSYAQYSSIGRKALASSIREPSGTSLSLSPTLELSSSPKPRSLASWRRRPIQKKKLTTNADVGSDDISLARSAESKHRPPHLPSSYTLHKPFLIPHLNHPVLEGVSNFIF